MISENWKNWITEEDLRVCIRCKKLHVKLFSLHAPFDDPDIPLHDRCRCEFKPVQSIYAGTATTKGIDGADWWLQNIGELPNYYISRKEAVAKGWNRLLGNLHEVLPGKMIYGGVFNNRHRQLPIAPGRVWYEADINYVQGYRNDERILFSNDGLIFITRNHFKTYSEVIPGGE